MKLIIGNKNYSSWSLRAWLAVKQSGLSFEEITVPMFGEQWGLEQSSDADIDAQYAWTLSIGGPSVVIAIIDTGVLIGHPEFAGRLLPGYDFVNDDPIPMDDHGHGTHVTSVTERHHNVR